MDMRHDPGFVVGHEMSSLSDPVKFKFSLDTMRVDSEGECVVTLKLPATEFPKAAKMAIMKDIVFEAVCTPTEVKTSEPSV